MDERVEKVLTNIRVFVEYDPDYEEQFNVCVFSLLRNCSQPIEVFKFSKDRLLELGLSYFPDSYFFIPYLENYGGYSIYLSKFIVMNCDISELLDILDRTNACFLHQGEHPGGLVVFNNRSKYTKKLSPDYVYKNKDMLLNMSWTRYFMNIPKKFNYLVKDGLAEEEPLILNYKGADTDNDYKYIYDSYLEEMSELEQVSEELHEFNFQQERPPKTISEKFWWLFGYKYYRDMTKQIYLPVYNMKADKYLSQVQNIQKIMPPECDSCRKKKK